MILLFLSLALVMSCNFDDIFSSDSSDEKTSETRTGTLKMLLTDAPGEFEEVNVTFSEIAVHFTGDTSEDDENGEGGGEPAEKTAGEWITITVEEQTHNLLKLSNGITAVLGEEELEAGHYSQIRIVISDAEVVNDGISYPLTISSGTLKFVCGFDIVPDESTELIVDFDAARSVHTTGKKEEYKLKPTIQIINNVKCGSISGLVTNPENLPVACAIAGEDTVSSTSVNKNNGKFMLCFLSEGIYTVSIADTLDQSYSAPDISVTAGSKTDLGEITLE